MKIFGLLAAILLLCVLLIFAISNNRKTITPSGSAAAIAVMPVHDYAVADPAEPVIGTVVFAIGEYDYTRFLVTSNSWGPCFRPLRGCNLLSGRYAALKQIENKDNICRPVEFSLRC